MSYYSRQQIDEVLKQITTATAPTAYLLCGDRFLCHQAAETISKTLIKINGCVHRVNESQAAELVSHLCSFTLLPGRQVYALSDTPLFHSQNIANALWKKANRAYQAKQLEKTHHHLMALFAAVGLPTHTTEQDLLSLNASQWKKTFNFSKPSSPLGWITEALAQDTNANSPINKPPKGDPGIALETALTNGIPAKNHLILLAEEVDRRKRLYKYFKEHQVIVDFSVESGASSRAQKAQNELLTTLVRDTLKPLGKTMPPPVVAQFLERIGFHPAAVVMEVEKVALYLGDQRQRIEREDLDLLVTRTRQEALFELTGALGKKDFQQTRIIADRVMSNNVHPLQIVALLRKAIRSLLLYRALIAQPTFEYRPDLSAQAFQSQVLPRLKAQSRWSEELSGHPYALYMQFKTAATFSLPTLRHWLVTILATERKLKRSRVAADLILNHLFFNLEALHQKATLQKHAKRLQ